MPDTCNALADRQARQLCGIFPEDGSLRPATAIPGGNPGHHTGQGGAGFRETDDVKPRPRSAVTLLPGRMR